jgi:hypothetical protein
MSNGSVSDVKQIKEDGFSIQHDWQRSFALEKDKFFVNYKKYGEKTSCYNFNCENGVIKLEDDSNVKIEKTGKVHCHFTFYKTV